MHAGIARYVKTAVIELACLCGIATYQGRVDPMRATTYPVGEAVLFALQSGCDEAIVAVGGSASTDGGVGFATALGAVFLDESAQPVPPNGAGLSRIRSVDTSGIDSRMVQLRSLVIATDVDNPLYGETDAARVYGPQKGASPRQVTELDAGLRNLSVVLAGATGVDTSWLPGAGAAGGIASSAVALFGARIEPGADLILSLLGVPEAVADADVVVTGEGSLDRQTLSGKGPIAVARLAAGMGCQLSPSAGGTRLVRLSSRHTAL